MRPIDADALIEFCAERWIPLNIDAVNMQPTIQPVATDTNVGDTISRQVAIDRFNVIRPVDPKKDEYTKGIDVGIAMCIVAVKDQPTIQPEPQEGHWIKHKIRDQQFIQNGYELVRCSECGMETTANELAGISLLGEVEPHFCPNCGARMKGERTK